jgi:flotillin
VAVLTSRQVEFKLPVVFTIGPMDPAVDLEGFKRYARFVSAMDRDQQSTTIQGMIEGETRGLTASLSIEEIFNAKDEFRTQVVTRIQADLDKLGVRAVA